MAIESLQRSISPPPTTPRRKSRAPIVSQAHGSSHISGLAAVEAGKAVVDDHLAYFSEHLAKVVRPHLDLNVPRLSISEYVNLYQQNLHDHGHHFVIHQHNHPIAGCHYDLRLQISSTSSCSWAIPYGVPGNPNSQRQGRMAIETRVHTLWNNLIESASHATGSLLIWDTGEYEILPRKPSIARRGDTDSESSGLEDDGSLTYDGRSENEKLIDAFKARYIRLRLRGTRLPRGYTITARLPSANNLAKHSRPMRRKRKPAKPATRDTDTEPEDEDTDNTGNAEVGAASDDEEESATIHVNNAYAGADNTIGSIHQRYWFASLDRANSGFKNYGGRWARRSPEVGFLPFFVRGANVERSVVTGRTDAEIMADEGVEGFKPRKMWRPILE